MKAPDALSTVRERVIAAQAEVSQIDGAIADLASQADRQLGHVEGLESEMADARADAALGSTNVDMVALRNRLTAARYEHADLKSAIERLEERREATAARLDAAEELARRVRSDVARLVASELARREHLAFIEFCKVRRHRIEAEHAAQGAAFAHCVGAPTRTNVGTAQLQAIAHEFDMSLENGLDRREGYVIQYAPGTEHESLCEALSELGLSTSEITIPEPRTAAAARTRPAKNDAPTSSSRSISAPVVATDGRNTIEYVKESDDWIPGAG